MRRVSSNDSGKLSSGSKDEASAKKDGAKAASASAAGVTLVSHRENPLLRRVSGTTNRPYHTGSR